MENSNDPPYTARRDLDGTPDSGVADEHPVGRNHDFLPHRLERDEQGRYETHGEPARREHRTNSGAGNSWDDARHGRLSGEYGNSNRQDRFLPRRREIHAI